MDKYLDSERIILEVEQNPCVYDSKHEDFKNRELRRIAWMTITKNVVGEQWEDMDAEIKQNIGKEVQKRWKSIKDSYIKYLRSEGGKSGDPNKKKRPYIYHKQMSFLQSACEQRQTSGNMNELQDSTGGLLESGHDVTIEPEPCTVTKSSRMAKKRNQDNFERDVLNILKSNVQPTSSHIQDPDEMFLLPQLPAIKHLSQSDKMDFQIKFIQLLQSYNRPRPSFNSPSVYNQDLSNPSSINTQNPTSYSETDDESVLSLFVL